MVTFDELVAGLVKPVVRHGFNPSTTTTSRYFPARFVPAVNGSVTRALLSEKTARDELAGSMNVNPYLELTYTFDGTGVDVAVGVGVGGSNVMVGVALTGVEVATEVTAAVAVDVGAGGTITLLRTMLGATHMARSSVGEPFALTRRMNFTF